jgi:hypothetical protein
MDVHYIITGQRDMSRLAPEEAALLDNYRNAPEAGRRSIRGAAASWEEPDMREKEA